MISRQSKAMPHLPLPCREPYEARIARPEPVVLIFKGRACAPTLMSGAFHRGIGHPAPLGESVRAFLAAEPARAADCEGHPSACRPASVMRTRVISIGLGACPTQ